MQSVQRADDREMAEAGVEPRRLHHDGTDPARARPVRGPSSGRSVSQVAQPPLRIVEGVAAGPVAEVHVAHDPDRPRARRGCGRSRRCRRRAAISSAVSGCSAVRQRIEHVAARAGDAQAVRADGVEQGGGGHGDRPIAPRQAVLDHRSARRTRWACHGQPSRPCSSARSRSSAPVTAPRHRRQSGVGEPERIDRAVAGAPRARSGGLARGLPARVSAHPSASAARALGAARVAARAASSTACRGSPWSASNSASSTSVSTPAASSSRSLGARRARRCVAPAFAAGGELASRRARSRTRGGGGARRAPQSPSAPCVGEPSSRCERRAARHALAWPGHSASAWREARAAPRARRPRRRSSSPSSARTYGDVLGRGAAGATARRIASTAPGQVAAQLTQVRHPRVAREVRPAVDHRLQLALASSSGRARRARRRGSARRSSPARAPSVRAPRKSWRASASSPAVREGVLGPRRPEDPGGLRVEGRVSRSRALAAGTPPPARAQIAAAAADCALQAGDVGGGAGEHGPLDRRAPGQPRRPGEHRERERRRRQHDERATASADRRLRDRGVGGLDAPELGREAAVGQRDVRERRAERLVVRVDAVAERDLLAALLGLEQRAARSRAARCRSTSSASRRPFGNPAVSPASTPKRFGSAVGGTPRLNFSVSAGTASWARSASGRGRRSAAPARCPCGRSP